MKLVRRPKAKMETVAPVSKVWPAFWPWGPFEQEVDRLLEEPFRGWMTPAREFLELWGPAADVYEDKENVYVKVELPGMKRDEIEVSMTGEMLNIAGERKEETEHKGSTSYRTERYFGSFHRSLALPTAVDPKKIHAHYKDGILTVTCPKTEEAKRREIEIKIE